MFSFLNTNTFGNLLKLVSGTFFAQLIPIVAMPIIARVFDPQDFGVLTIFIGIAGVLAISSSLRFELAIPQVKNDVAARHVFSLCLVLLAIITVLLLTIVKLGGSYLYDIFKLADFEEVGLLYVLVLSFFCSGIIQVSINRSIRLSEFSEIAVAKIIIAIGYVVSQLLLGLLVVPAGLVFGYVMGQVLGAIFLFHKSFSWLPSKSRPLSLSNVKNYGKEYLDLPIYSAPGAMIDAFCSTLPLLVVAATYDLTTAGMLGMAYRVLGIPASMISLSVSQIIFQKVSSSDGFKPGFARRLIIQSMLWLALIIIPFVLIITIFGPDLFALAFGEEWRLAGSYAGVLIVGLSVQFLASPNSLVLTLKENVKLGAFWQILRLTTVSFVLFFGRNYDFGTFLRAFVLHEVFIYLIYIWFIFIGAQRRVAC